MSLSIHRPMKVSKIFGFVLFLHVLAALLIVQPGCHTTQPPTEVHTQERTLPSSPARSSDGLIESTRVEPLDASFNADFEDESLSAPRRPSGEFSEFQGLEPLAPAPTVAVAGPSFKDYTVERGDSLWAIARREGVSVNELYEANDLNKNSVLKVGQVIRIPVDGAEASVDTVTPDAYQPSGQSGPTQDYTVRAGDTLSRIANRFDTTVRAIKAANNKSSDMIRVGEELVIPVSSDAAGEGDAPAAGPSQGRGSSTSASATRSGDHRTHVVEAGEYPATIARRYGMTTNELLALNEITDPRKLRVGQELKVSATGSAANVDSRTETVTAPATAEAPSPSVEPVPRASVEPVEIRVIEADPLVEGEAAEIDTEAMFEDAVEIPVIRLEDEGE